MPNVTTCSRDGKTPAHRVEISVAMWNVADPNNPTASILGADACAECQEPILKTLFEFSVEMLREQAPLHKRALELAEKRDRATRAMATFRPAIEGANRQAEKVAAENPRGARPTIDELLPEDIRTRKSELEKEIDAAETERASVIMQATDASDALQAKLDKALKKKK